jgi:hypothetical protein
MQLQAKVYELVGLGETSEDEPGDDQEVAAVGEEQAPDEE